MRYAEVDPHRTLCTSRAAAATLSKEQKGSHDVRCGSLRCRLFCLTVHNKTKSLGQIGQRGNALL